MRSEHSWSLLTPKPIHLFLKSHGEYITFWNGIVMPYSAALCVGLELIGIWPSPEMKEKIHQTFEKLYYTGAFQNRNWDRIAESKDILNYYKRKMQPHVVNHFKNYTGPELFEMFDLTKARVEE